MWAMCDTPFPLLPQHVLPDLHWDGGPVGNFEPFAYGRRAIFLGRVQTCLFHGIREAAAYAQLVHWFACYVLLIAQQRVMP